MNRHTPHRHRRAGFTIVEILVVIAIITILLALLLPALGAMRAQARKTGERNTLRQYGVAWELYSNQNSSELMPGYLPPDVQDNWEVQYRYQDESEIEDPEIAAPYTWRLLPFLSYNMDAATGYRRDWEFQTLQEDAETVAEQPPFGYNGYYLGGHYEMQDVSGQSLARPQFSGANVVARTTSQISRADNQLVFVSTSRQETGVYRELSDYEPGHYDAVPPMLGDEELWSPGTATSASGDEAIYTGQIEVLADEASIPIGRHTGNAVIYFADGHVDGTQPGTLTDMRQWIPRADTRDFQHSSD